MHLTWTYDFRIQTINLCNKIENEYLRGSVKGCFRISPNDSEYPRKLWTRFYESGQKRGRKEREIERRDEEDAGEKVETRGRTRRTQG